MSNIKKEGQIQISDDVLSIIAYTAAMEVDGVAFNQNDSKKSRLNKKNLQKIKIKSENGKIVASLSIIIKFGYKINKVASDVQKKVKYALETMAGVSIKEIHINISGIKIESNIKKIAKKKA